MTTKHKYSVATGRKGVNFVRAIVEARNSMFQEIDSHNDIGNDAYIEFTEGEDGTGCCIAAQIKSGESYATKDGNEYLLKSDKAHFEYWASHILPVVGVIYDPERDIAVWVNISAYLENNPGVIASGPYTIRVPSNQVFSSSSFAQFQAELLQYSKRYRSQDAFVRSVENFLSYDNEEQAIAALRALFSFHRDKRACWHFLIFSLLSCTNSRLLRAVTSGLVLIPGHGDIWWHERNMLNAEIRVWAETLMQRTYGRREIEILLNLIDKENGIGRGTFGQGVHAIVRILPENLTYLYEIIKDPGVDDDVKWFAIEMLVYDLQMADPEHTADILYRFQVDNPDSKIRSLVHELRQMVLRGDWADPY